MRLLPSPTLASITDDQRRMQAINYVLGSRPIRRGKLKNRTNTEY
jgi:hypothetical protein